jgi:uncharacterized protein (DUF1501 family)
VKRTLAGSSLVAAGSIVPQFIAQTAEAAQPGGGETVLVVVELTGGNDGLNTVIPYGDDLYHKARPTLRYEKNDIIKVNDLVGLHPSLSGLTRLKDAGHLAIVQGVGYPNPNRSHFESMDIWQTGDPLGKQRSGWLSRGVAEMRVRPGHISAFHLGNSKLPLALRGAAASIPSLDPARPFGLQLGQEQLPSVNNSRFSFSVDNRQALTATDSSQQVHKRSIVQLAEMADGESASPLAFVQRTSLETYKTVDRLDAILKEKFQLPKAKYITKGNSYRYGREGLDYNLQLAARMIQGGLGTRVFYVALDGFDTHGSQREMHQQLLATLGQSIDQFFTQLATSGDDKRVVLMTYSEFGRRVAENGSKGTDHGAASCMFLAGPKVAGGLVGAHPSLAPDALDDGDIKHEIDFRQVYATLLDRWLTIDSRRVLGQKFGHVKVLKG